MKVLLLHAFPLDERMWDQQLDALREQDVETPNLYDLPGNSVDGWAEQLVARIEGELAVVGASLGGYVALSMARRARARVRGLLLAGARAAADTPERRAARDDAIRVLRKDGVEAWAPAAPAPPPPERTADELVRTVEALRDRTDASDVVRAFQGPLWVAVGEKDPYLPVDEARELVAAAPNGRLELFEGVGHFPNLEQPDRFNALLREFLSAL